MAPVARGLGLYFIRVAGQWTAAGISESEFGDPAPGPGAVFIRFQSGFSGHPDSVVIVRGPAGSRVAAQTGRQQWRHHRFFDFNTGIRGGFHFHYLCTAGSDHDDRPSGGGLCYRCGSGNYGKPF